jgi:hypothetical protein
MNIERKNNKEYMVEYRKKNNAEITCELCGGHYKSYYKSRHYNSKIHKSCLSVIEKIENENKKKIIIENNGKNIIKEIKETNNTK